MKKITTSPLSFILSRLRDGVLVFKMAIFARSVPFAGRSVHEWKAFAFLWLPSVQSASQKKSPGSFGNDKSLEH